MPVVLTKIRIPLRRKDILRRQRLIDLLHQNIYRKLIFISAPAGYGKTTLLTDFANDIDANVCWYRIDRDDKDIIPFALHLIGSIHQNFPEFGQETMAILEAGGGVPDAVGLGLELVNEMVRYVTDFSVLILDDYHMVGEQQQIVDLIETLLEYLPDHVRIIMASRSVYGIPAANLYVRNDLATISADEMRFRPDEINLLIHDNYSVTLSEDQVNEIAQRADGWIIAILLALRALEQGIKPKFQQTSSEMYDFLAQEVVALQPEHLRNFLIKTSILDEFNVELCNALLQTDDCQRFLQELEERNLFVTRIETEFGTTNYRYHQLFGEFLSQRLSDTEPQTKLMLHDRAANWYFEQEFWEDAVYHKMAAGKREEAAVWMEQRAGEFFVAGRTSVISEWIQSITEPVDIRNRAPWLSLTWAKVLYERGDYGQGDQYLEIAESVLMDTPDVNRRASLFVTKGMGRIYQGQPQEALDLAQISLELMKDQPENYYRFQAYRLVGMSRRHLGKTEESVQSLEMAAHGFRTIVARQDIQERQAAHDLAETLNDLGIAYFEHGNILESQKCLEEVLTIRRKQKSNLGALAIALNNVGYMYYLLGRYREAWRAYEEAYAVASSLRHHRGIVHILNSRGDLLRDLEEWKDAETSYLEAKRRADSSDRYALFSTYIGLSELERRRGNYHDALYWLREAARIRGQSVESPDYQVGLGQVYLDMGQYEMALSALNQALTSWTSHNRPNQNMSLAFFLLGRVYYEIEKYDEIIPVLNKCLAISAQLGYDQFLVVAARVKRDFLQFISQQKDLGAYIQNISQRVNVFPSLDSLVSPKSEQPSTPHFQLKVSAFGPGVVFKEGTMLTSSEWKSSNARAVLFFIVDRKGLRKEEIALDLWPDFSQAKATSNFQSTLWRLRKALGNKDAIIFDQNTYVINPNIQILYDVDDFLKELELAHGTKVSSSKKIERLQRAINLYKGEFLPDLSGSWVDIRREELLRLFLSSLRELGDMFTMTHEYKKAREIYEQILRIDPYQDAIHLAVMQCLVNLGSPAAAKAHYFSYRDFLWKELKAKPQAELEDFCAALP
jgi:LuxR family transcriptional regulator, maltose regulon positive regulatory protein